MHVRSDDDDAALLAGIQRTKGALVKRITCK